ncbi:MAG: hypothetical protein Q9191_003866, partial [Dirinaria sp. TL-2023a]
MPKRLLAAAPSAPLPHLPTPLPQDPSEHNDEWKSFLSLQSHITDFKLQNASGAKNEDGLSTWQTIELMSQAAKSYGNLQEDLGVIQEATARILTNTHTLTTPTLDPLGLCLSPLSARLNHSCEPNTFIVFSGPTLSVRSLTPITPNTELTISYIDNTVPYSLRNHELSTRYFFTCTCSLCSTANPSPESKKENEEEEKTSALLTRLKTSSPNESLSLLSDALKAAPPAHRYPTPALTNQMLLTALSLKRWGLALQTALQRHEVIDPAL